MKFTPLEIAGACLVRPEPIADDRGFFARTYCESEFAAAGLTTHWVQANRSFNKAAGTLRGLHFQRPPMVEAKLVGCAAGAIFDVIVDLRLGSATYGRALSVQLDADAGLRLHIPPGLAHGFQTLADNTEVTYMHSGFYSSGHEGGLNHADPAIGIEWPLPISAMSERDLGFPSLADLEPIAL